MNPNQNNPLNGQPAVGGPPNPSVNPVNPQVPPQSPLSQTPPPPPQTPPVQMAPPQPAVSNPQMTQLGYQTPPQGQPVTFQQPGYNQAANPNAYYAGQASGKSTVLSRLKLNKKALMSAFGIFLISLASVFAFNFLSGNKLTAEKELAVNYLKAVQADDYDKALTYYPNDAQKAINRVLQAYEKTGAGSKDSAIKDLFKADKATVGDSKEIKAETAKVVQGQDYKCALVYVNLGSKNVMLMEIYEGESVKILTGDLGNDYDAVEGKDCDEQKQALDTAVDTLNGMVEMIDQYADGVSEQGQSAVPDISELFKKQD